MSFRDLWRAIDERSGLSRALGPILRHPVPPGTGWKYVFGSATLFAFVLQVVTGIALATSYVPSSGQAYDTLRFIEGDAIGRVVRGLHYFGASAMVLLVGIHVVRVVLTGSYKFPREVNWLTGAVLLLLTLGMGFTGQLLRWDDNAVWSVIVGAEQAGRVPVAGAIVARFILAGNTLGGQTLSRFFSFHVFFIPALIFAFLGYHLYLVLHNGISEPPVAGRPVDPATYRAWYEDLLRREGRPFWPDAAWRDAVFGASMIVFVFVLALVVGAPALGGPPDPSSIRVYPRPDWYLLWYYAVLALLPHGIESWVIVLAPLVVGAILISVPFVSGRGERAPSRRPLAVILVACAVTMILGFWVAGSRAAWSPDFSAKPLPPDVVGSVTPVAARGATLFHERGCQYCHEIGGRGGRRGPDLSDVGARRTREELVLRIMNGGVNMPPFAATLSPEDLDALVSFLATRR